ncbi:MAG: 50S ribosomal protein L35 [Trebonia sp.]|jgi:large subunit ribosomal protein L35
MPKMKNHSGAGKRFKLTGTGKVMRQRADRAHYNEHKSSRVTRRLFGRIELAPSNTRQIKRLLGK